MLGTFGLIPFESIGRSRNAEARGRVVSVARVRDPEPAAKRLAQLESELDTVRRALAAAKSEIVKIRCAERSAHYLAMHDALTSLPNRRCFRLRLEQAMTAKRDPQRSFALLYFDLDGFKQLNDARGHHFGDELLRIIASRLARAVRAQDLVSRLGGDEFACLIDGTPQRERLTMLANKLYDAVRAPLRIDGHDLSVCASIGIAIAPSDGQSADDLMRNADSAMYRAKRQRTGHQFFSA